MARIDSPNGFIGPIGNGSAQAGYFSRVGVNTQVPTNDLHIVQSSGSAPALRIEGTGTNVGAYIKSTTAGAQTLLQFENTSTGSTNPVKLYLPGSSTTLQISIAAVDVHKFAAAAYTLAPASGVAANLGITTAGAGVTANLNFTSGTSTTARIYQTNAGSDLRFLINSSDRLALQSTGDVQTLGGNLVIGTAAVATTATSGFIYAPSCAGVPTGVPTTKTGTVPIVIDSTDSKLYAYIGGAWKSTTLA